MQTFLYLYMFISSNPLYSSDVQIGQYIASNGGVVAAEELAPYLEIDSTEGFKVIWYMFGCVYILRQAYFMW